MATPFVEVLSAIRPKNNADFAIMSAEHISLTTTDDTRISTLLQGLTEDVPHYVQRVIQDTFDAIDEQYKPAAVMQRVATVESKIDANDRVLASAQSGLAGTMSTVSTLYDNTKNVKLKSIDGEPTLTLVNDSDMTVQKTNLGTGDFYASGTIGNDAITVKALSGHDVSIVTDKDGKVLDYYDANGCKNFSKNVYAPNIDALQMKVDDIYNAVQTLKANNSI